MICSHSLGHPSAPPPLSGPAQTRRSEPTSQTPYPSKSHRAARARAPGPDWSRDVLCASGVRGVDRLSEWVVLAPAYPTGTRKGVDQKGVSRRRSTPPIVMSPRRLVHRRVIGRVPAKKHEEARSVGDLYGLSAQSQGEKGHCSTDLQQPVSLSSPPREFRGEGRDKGEEKNMYSCLLFLGPMHTTVSLPVGMKLLEKNLPKEELVNICCVINKHKCLLRECFLLFLIIAIF